jgi:hypothetical protein
MYHLKVKPLGRMVADQLLAIEYTSVPASGSSRMANNR